MAFARTSQEVVGVGRIDYLEFGSPDGVPAFYFHGTPSSASEAFWMQVHAADHGVRLIAIDRQGYLRSAVLGDLDAVGKAYSGLADDLGLDRFAVIGFSGGTNTALAVAAECNDRLTVAHIGGGLTSVEALRGAGMGPARRVMFAAMSSSPWLARRLVGVQGRTVGKRLRNRLPSPTYAILQLLTGSAAGSQLPALEEFVRRSDPADLASVVEGFIEGSAGPNGALRDIASLRTPPDATGVRAPVELWHGTADNAVPIGAARYLASLLPNATLHELEGEGHFVFLSHGPEVCASIAAAAT